MAKTYSNIQRNNYNNLTNAVDYAFNQNLFNLNTVMICVFNEYSNNTTYGNVTQLISNIDMQKKPINSVIQFDVPISYIMGGEAGINITYKKGDLVLVVYSQQSLHDLKMQWSQGKNPNNLIPTNYGKFTLEDGIIIGKVSRTKPQVIIDINDNGITINSNNKPIIINSGSADATINCSNAKINASNNINIDGSNAIIKASNIKLDGEVTCTGLLKSVNIESSAGIKTPSLSINNKDYTQHAHSSGTYTTQTGAVTGSSGSVV